jgi:hypothetical protein
VEMRELLGKVKLKGLWERLLRVWARL